MKFISNKFPDDLSDYTDVCVFFSFITGTVCPRVFHLQFLDRR